MGDPCENVNGDLPVQVRVEVFDGAVHFHPVGRPVFGERRFFGSPDEGMANLQPQRRKDLF